MVQQVNSEAPRALQSQHSEVNEPNRDAWSGFFAHFSQDERKQFIRNMTHDISVLIQKQMRKMRKSLEKLREY